MTVVTGQVQDIGMAPLSGALIATAVEFRTSGDFVVAPESRSWPIVNGDVSVDLLPGPTRITIQVGSHARDSFDVIVPEDPVTLARLVEDAFPWTPAVVSAVAGHRAAAEAAAERAETAADGVDDAIAGAADQVVAAVEGDRVAAEAARTGAESARDTAEGHAVAASGSESAAAASASAAAESATDAASSAAAAGSSESAAAGHAGAAATSAGEASDSADAAASSASQSAGFRDAAEGHAIAADGSADAAAGSATAAAGSAQAANTDADRADAAAATAQSYRWVPQGDWVAGSYEAGDVVVYDGASYYAGSATSAEPPAAPWVVLSAGGGISDASELTGALTGAVDASAAMVVAADLVGGGPDVEMDLSTVATFANSAMLSLSALGPMFDTKSDVGHQHPVTDLDATGTRSSSTYLRGDGSWATPPNTTYEAVTTAAIDAGAEDVGRLTTASRMRHAVQRWVTGSGATPVSAIGQALAAAPSAASARATIEAEQEPWTGTQSAYNALGTKDPNRTYYIV